jgi:hypothetical protein
MLLSNLMHVWGEEEGLAPKKVLDSLELNHRQAGGGTRFSVDRLGEDWEITVHPRAGGGMGTPPRRRRAYSADDNISTKDKMGMGLDDIIRSGERGSSSRDNYRAESSRADGNSAGKAPEVIDLEDEHFSLKALEKLAPPPMTFASTGWARRRREDERSDRREFGRHDRGHDRDHEHKVKVSKFVAYILKRGHDEHDIDLWQEYADLNDLVKVINRKRVYGEYTVADLKNTLQDTDNCGRFQYWKDWVRKVDKSDRGLAKEFAQPVDAEMEVDAGLGASTADANSPPPPPGDHWVQYTDEGQDKTWWYYEGPLGKWWCDDDNSEPRVWNFDE